jgi:beta-phosphoglucomutase
MAADAPRAVLWDMDGTLIDSAEYHWLGWQETLGREGHPLTRERFLSTFGRRNDAVLRDLLGEDLADAEIARIAAAKEDRYRELVRTGGIEPLPGVREWLARLHDVGWRQAVASSSPRLNIAIILDALGLAGTFDAVAGEEDVGRGKPDPQIFLVAAMMLGVPPARCVVVEDAPAGVEAARRAGMRRIGVGTAHGALDADLAVPSLADLPDDAFDRLLANT